MSAMGLLFRASDCISMSGFFKKGLQNASAYFFKNRHTSLLGIHIPIPRKASCTIGGDWRPSSLFCNTFPHAPTHPHKSYASYQQLTYPSLLLLPPAPQPFIPYLLVWASPKGGYLSNFRVPLFFPREQTLVAWRRGRMKNPSRRGGCCTNY